MSTFTSSIGPREPYCGTLHDIFLSHTDTKDAPGPKHLPPLHVSSGVYVLGGMCLEGKCPGGIYILGILYCPVMC